MRREAAIQIAAWTQSLSQRQHDAVRRALCKAAADAKWEVRKAVATALGNPELEANRSLERALAALEDDPNGWVREAARAALARRQAPPPDHPGRSDPTLEFVATQVAEFGRRARTPRAAYELAQAVGGRYYRDLSAEIAHEIRTLVTPIQANAQFLQRYLVDNALHDAQTERALGTILERTELLEQLLRDLQEYSGPSRETHHEHGLRELLERAVRLAQDRVAELGGELEQVELELNCTEALWVVGAPLRLRRALANVIANAYQAMDQGGKLTVHATSGGDGMVTVRVSDTGCGMSERDVRAALKRFNTTRKDQGGTGLGLPIVKRIVEELHGGRLLIESTPGSGTTVQIDLPQEEVL